MCSVCFNKSLVGLPYICILLDQTQHGVRNGINQWRRLLYNLQHRSVSVNQMSGQNGRGRLNSTAWPLDCQQKDDEIQVSTLLYCLGADTDDADTNDVLTAPESLTITGRSTQMF